MIFRTNKYYLLILLAAFNVGGCGDFSGNYDEIESSSTSTDSTVKALNSWGSAGNGSGQYMGYGSIISNDGYIYISSRDGSGISKFDQNGNTIAHNSTYDIRQINFHPDNKSKIYGYNYESVCKVRVFNLNLTEILSDNSSISCGDHGLAVDINGNVYVSGYHNSYQVSKYSDNGTLGLSLITSWGSLGTSSGQFSNPQYLHYDNNLIYVVDEALNNLNGNKIVTYNLSGNLQNTISMSTYGTNTIYDICFNDSKIYSATGNYIVKFDIANTSNYKKTQIYDETGNSTSGNHCTILSDYIYILSDTKFKIYKYNLSSF